MASSKRPGIRDSNVVTVGLVGRDPGTRGLTWAVGCSGPLILPNRHPEDHGVSPVTIVRPPISIRPPRREFAANSLQIVFCTIWRNSVLQLQGSRSGVPIRYVTTVMISVFTRNTGTTTVMRPEIRVKERLDRGRRKHLSEQRLAPQPTLLVLPKSTPVIPSSSGNRRNAKRVVSPRQRTAFNPCRRSGRMGGESRLFQPVRRR